MTMFSSIVKKITRFNSLH